MTPHYYIREAPFRAVRDGMESTNWFYLSASPDWAHAYVEDTQLGVESLTSFWWADAVEFA